MKRNNNNKNNKNDKNNKNFLYLIIGFGIVMLSFCGAQQFVSTYLPGEVGLTSLILIYSLFGISSLSIAPVIVSKFGSKKCLLASSGFYGLYIASLAAASPGLVYGASCVLGISAAVMWTAAYSYLTRVSSADVLGVNSGLFYMAYGLGAFVGILVLGLVSTAQNYPPYFLFDAGLILAAVFFFSLMDDIKPEGDVRRKIHKRLFEAVKTMKSLSVLRASTTAFLTYAIFGLVVAQVPIQLARMGLSAGISGTAVFFLVPVFLSKKIGKYSDKYGRLPLIFMAYVLAVPGMILLAVSAKTVLLFAGLIFLTLAFTILQPCFTALQGDISSEDTIENVSGVFLLVRNLGTVSAFVGAHFLGNKYLYFSVAALTVVSFVLLYTFPNLKSNTERAKIRKKINFEIEQCEV
ncbi:MAG: MFS transporter [bacterium]|nr:MFS transporter [bacterium]